MENVCIKRIRKECVSQEGDSVTLEYRLFRTDISDRESYSLEIKEGGVVCEKIMLEDVCCDLKDGLELISLFAENTVTVCSALYVMDDISLI